MVNRVVLVTESFLPSLNGVTNSVLRVLDTYRQRGIDALIIAPTAPSPRYLGFEIIRTASFPLKQFNVAVPGLWLQDAIADFQPDVVHVASPFILGGQAIAAAERLGIPSVAIYQTELSGYTERYNLALAKPLLDRAVAAIHSPATMNLAPTKQTADYLKGLGVSAVEVWGRGVDLDLYHPRRKAEPATLALRQKWAPSGQRIVGYVGRLAAEKQVHRMRELFDLEPDTVFVLVGDGPERARLEAEFADFPVVFAGKLTGLELAAAYAAFDVFVHFGTEETFGQTIQEAQASGLPLVAPNSGGPMFLIENGVSGFLAEPHSVGGYNGHVRNLLTDARLRARIGENARRAVAGKSWEANNEQLLKHYEAAMVAKAGAKNLELA
ncbi:MAG: glycosyltransferase family 4 protein [Micrococcales bacterium]